MYIYADESGNTGKDVFSAPEFYWQGAIFALDDIEPLVGPILTEFKRREGVSRIHANEMRLDTVREIGEAILDALDASTTWHFHITVIHKPYLVTTKFVDTIFDSGENLGARWVWYNVAFFRHALCCLIDDMLTPRNRRAFWQAYLTDDYEGVKAAVRNARTYLDRYTKDRRLINVVLDAFSFALRYPEEITLMASRRRDSYKGHTPNMVGFSSLAQSAHNFAETHGSVPQAFYHDQQTEFGKSMTEYVDLFARLRLKQPEITRPWQPTDGEIKEYDLGKFSMPSSKDFLPLQAVDVLLWVVQRESEPSLREIRERIFDKSDPFHISRTMSEMIRLAGLKLLAESPLSDDDLLRAEGLRDQMETAFRQKLKEFSRKTAE